MHQDTGTNLAPPGTFAHGYQAANWLARNNMGLEGTLHSTEMLTFESPEAFPSIRDVPVEALAKWEDVPPIALLPRGRNLLQAKNVRIARGLGRPMSDLGMTEEEAGRVVRVAAFELALEGQRRAVRPESPSRLSCVFVADDTPAGRNYAQKLATMHGFVMIVEVPFALRCARVDARWLGHSLDPLSEQAMRGYWSGEPRSDRDPLWEWLVDGVIRCADAEQFGLLRSYNRRLGDVIPGAAGWAPPAT